MSTPVAAAKPKPISERRVPPFADAVTHFPLFASEYPEFLARIEAIQKRHRDRDLRRKATCERP